MDLSEGTKNLAGSLYFLTKWSFLGGHSPFSDISYHIHMGGSINGVTPKSSILIFLGFCHEKTIQLLRYPHVWKPSVDIYHYHFERRRTFMSSGKMRRMLLPWVLSCPSRRHGFLKNLRTLKGEHILDVPLLKSWNHGNISHTGARSK